MEGRQSQVADRTRLSNRIMDLRTSTSQSIFRIQAGVGNLFRSALDDRRFVEIHSPKLQARYFVLRFDERKADQSSGSCH